jgi:hypothetical protein
LPLHPPLFSVPVKYKHLAVRNQIKERMRKRQKYGFKLGSSARGCAFDGIEFRPECNRLCPTRFQLLLTAS